MNQLREIRYHEDKKNKWNAFPPVAFLIQGKCMGAQQSQRRLHYPARVVLVGGGHANVQVIKHLAQHFVVESQGLHLTLLSDQPTAWYSGMMPGCISGRYHADRLQINLQELADWYAI